MKQNTQDFEGEVNSDYLLEADDFRTFINPKVLAETVTHEHAWEYCLSFPNIRCMVKRPVAIHVSFLNCEGDEMEEKLYDFDARVFMHELDHLQGKTMLHWNISCGNIDVIRDKPDENLHLQSTVEFYKQKIDSISKNFPKMFEDK